MAKPRSAARSTARARKIAEAAPFQAGSDGGNHWPMSPSAERAEDRVGQRVHADVGVGMADEAAVERELHAAERDAVAGAEGVHVEAVAGADVHAASSDRAAPASRSAAVVILKFASSPGTSRTVKPGGAGDRDVVGGVAGVCPVRGEDLGESGSPAASARARGRRAAPSSVAASPSARQRASTTGSAGKRGRGGVERGEHGGDHGGRDEGPGGVVDQHALGRVAGERLEARRGPRPAGSRAPATGGRSRGSAQRGERRVVARRGPRDGSPPGARRRRDAPSRAATVRASTRPAAELEVLLRAPPRRAAGPGRPPRSSLRSASPFSVAAQRAI